LVSNVKEKKMADKRFWLGMLVMALAFGMTVAGCIEPDEGSSMDGDGGGSYKEITITGLGEYNGWYANIEGRNQKQTIGGGTESIYNGSVTVRMSYTGKSSFALILTLEGYDNGAGYNVEKIFWYTNGESIPYSIESCPVYTLDAQNSTISFTRFQEKK
jgi:hypothetical protein